MGNNDQKINRSMMIGWVIIVAILVCAYFGEYLKGTRSGSYMVVFSLITVLPLLACMLLHLTGKAVHSLRYFIVVGYSIMYVFVLLTGKTTMVFTYIFPLLTLIVLYHQPNLVLIMGVLSLIANLAYDAKLFWDGNITLENSRDVEIQLALILLCFGFLYIASRLYDSIHKENEKYVQQIEEKNREIQSATLETISTIANIIDAKDEYTKGHSQRVAEYSAAIARELGYSEERVRNVRNIALLHDIGKIGIPDAVLKKPGRLDSEEFSLMKQHTTIGATILQDYHLIENLEVGASCHHEKYNGTGYPYGLREDKIPEVARIIGLADAYDAMTSTRVYRKAMPDEVVLAELRKNCGSQFDPRITEVFIKMWEENRLPQLRPECAPDFCSSHRES